MGLGLVTIPAGMALPAATVFYWCINNTFSLVWTGALVIPGVKGVLGILPPPMAGATNTGCVSA